MKIDLHSEYRLATAAVRQPHLDRIRELGVHPTTIAEHALRFRFMGFGILNGTIDSGGHFVPGDGPAHVVQPVIEGGELADLVAWRSLQPSRWGLRGGKGWALGADTLSNFGSWANSTTLCESPLDWLRLGCAGGCIVDWDAPEVETLAGWETIETSASLALALRSRIERSRRIPDIIAKDLRNAA